MQTSDSIIPSSFQHLIDGNLAPSNIERVQLREYRQRTKSELETLSEEVAQLELRLAKLQRRQHNLDNALQKTTALLSPFRDIAPEILATIFSFCLPIRHDALMHPMDAPLLLGRVCRRWREVAYRTPQLWSSLHIVVAFDHRVALRRLEGVKQWLLRGGVCHLSITMVYQLSYYSPSRAEHEPLVMQSYSEALLAHSLRWSFIDFVLPSSLYPLYCEHLASLAGHHVPLLKRFGITGSEMNGRSELDTRSQQSLRFLRGTRTLRSLSLHNYTYVSTAPIANMRSLGTLDLSFSRLPLTLAIPDLLSGCTNLSELILRINVELHADANVFQMQDRHRHIEVTHLQTMRLLSSYFFSNPTLCYILDTLAAPNLKFFEFDCRYPTTTLRVPHPNGDTFAAVKHFIKRSSLSAGHTGMIGVSSLHRLQINGAARLGDNQDIAEILALVPQLTHLKLSGILQEGFARCNPLHTYTIPVEPRGSTWAFVLEYLCTKWTITWDGEVLLQNRFPLPRLKSIVLEWPTQKYVPVIKEFINARISPPTSLGLNSQPEYDKLESFTFRPVAGTKINKWSNSRYGPSIPVTDNAATGAECINEDQRAWNDRGVCFQMELVPPRTETTDSRIEPWHGIAPAIVAEEYRGVYGMDTL